MPDLTTENLPYPTDTDPVADMAVAMMELAKAVQQRDQHGTAVITLTTASSTGSVNVTFPRAFAAGELPDISLTPSNINYLVSWAARSNTGFTAFVRHHQGTTANTTVSVCWSATGKRAE